MEFRISSNSGIKFLEFCIKSLGVFHFGLRFLLVSGRQVLINRLLYVASLKELEASKHRKYLLQLDLGAI